jgi:hypothetical protein
MCTPYLLLLSSFMLRDRCSDMSESHRNRPLVRYTKTFRSAPCCESIACWSIYYHRASSPRRDKLERKLSGMADLMPLHQYHLHAVKFRRIVRLLNCLLIARSTNVRLVMNICPSSQLNSIKVNSNQNVNCIPARAAAAFTSRWKDSSLYLRFVTHYKS